MDNNCANDLLIYMLVGSIPCGTSVPSSDIDYRGVNKKTEKMQKDSLIYSLSNYIYRISIGEIIPVEMLFTPEKFWKSEPTKLWYDIVDNKYKILSKQMYALTSECKRQFLIYGVKGATRNYLKGFFLFSDFIEKLDENKTVEFYFPLIEEKINSAFIEWHPFIKIKKENENNYIEVMGLNYKGKNTIKEVKKSISIQANVYKKTTEKFQKGEGYSKRLYHAARDMVIAEQLLTTGVITYPLPEHEYLLAIRTQRVTYANAIARLENFALKVDELLEKSIFIEKPDYEFIKTIHQNCIQEKIW